MHSTVDVGNISEGIQEDTPVCDTCIGRAWYLMIYFIRVIKGNIALSELRILCA